MTSELLHAIKQRNLRYAAAIRIYQGMGKNMNTANSKNLNLHSGVHSASRPLTGLLYLPRVIVRMENSVE
jgi:hypothetical protein